jgi:autotransporter passenger strand-loop-strand repeat protein
MAVYSVSSGQTLSGVTLNSGDFAYILSGGSAASLTVSSGGQEIVSSGGSAIGTIVDASGSAVIAGGTATGSILSGTLFGPWGHEDVVSGGIASGTTIEAGGQQTVGSGGTAISTTVESGGDLIASAGGLISAMTVLAGGTASVQGSAVSTTISGGMLINQGYTTSTTIDGGYEIVSGGLAFDATVHEGYLEGASYYTTIEHSILGDGGSQTISWFASAIGTVISSGGVESISEGAVSVEATIESGGGQEVGLFGSATSATISRGGFQFISAGGRAWYTTISGGEQIISGGYAYNTIVDSGGTEYADGTAVSTTIANGGLVIVSAYATVSGTTIQSGGAELVFASGSAIDTTVEDGGNLILLPGAIASGITGNVVATGVVIYQPGAPAVVAPFVSGATIGTSAVGYLFSGGSAISTTVGDGGQEFIFAGGLATGTFLGSGGVEYISSGGTAVGGTVGPTASAYAYSDGMASGITLAGVLFISSGGIASQIAIQFGGDEIVSSAGSAIATQVNYGGVENVQSAGNALGTLVRNGGLISIEKGGLAASTMLGLGAIEFLYDGGFAVSTTVGLSGSENIYFGGSASSTTISSGGKEIIYFGASSTDTVVLIGGAIAVNYLTYAPDGSASVDSVTNILTVSVGGQIYTQQLSGDYTGDQFAVTQDTTGGTAITNEGLVCFCADTLITTPAGQRKVQDLAASDLVTTWTGAARRIVWIGTGAALATRGRRGAATPVIVRKGALADNVPFRDLRVTKGHAFMIDGALIPVEFLVNHRSIAWDDRAQEVALYHIELETHDVLIANGAPAESYRDDGNRWLFRNADTGWNQPPKPPCGPVLTGGPQVDAAWRQLLDRAGARPGFILIDDPDLCLFVDGERIDAARRHGPDFIFTLPRPPASVRIASRAAAPQELGIARDPRVLGIALTRVTLRSGGAFRVIEADDARLTDGFHTYEPECGWRWTDGNALLPNDLLIGFDAPMELVLRVGSTSRYPLLAPYAPLKAANG